MVKKILRQKLFLKTGLLIFYNIMLIYFSLSKYKRLQRPRALRAIDVLEARICLNGLPTATEELAYAKSRDLRLKIQIRLLNCPCQLLLGQA